MRPVDLDFQPRPLSPTGLALLIVGLLAAAAVLFDYRQVAGEAAAWRSELAKLREPARRPPVRAGDDQALQAVAQAAGLVSQDLQRPWETLFTALEEAKTDEVALLAINPDPARGTVRITAEAKQREAILAFIDKLGKTPGLRNVFLAEEQVQQQDPEKPIRFIMSADWTGGPA